MNNKNEEAKVRNKKKSSRNRERQISHQINLLEKFADNIKSEFSEECWVSSAELYKQVSNFLTLDEYTSLGHIWRDSYISPINHTQLGRISGMIKLRLQSVT